ncbi:hypothetical protein MC7420_4802 [Coleofasciculus chthonoplastes PCC 7420]|uniref:Uncharacterized protein n=1 Tax=Coleofasciculus chthonoplastes PCC 7420 TaxID=118168 RepID=B4VP56_9CYAN|nr:hypothetical protein MC7420_4802 [Coleofasciculus chthonoplastes PCC 7420]
MQDPLGIAAYPVMKGRDGSRTPIPWQAEAHQAGFTTPGFLTTIVQRLIQPGLTVQ